MDDVDAYWNGIREYEKEIGHIKQFLRKPKKITEFQDWLKFAVKLPATKKRSARAIRLELWWTGKEHAADRAVFFTNLLTVLRYCGIVESYEDRGMIYFKLRGA